MRILLAGLLALWPAALALGQARGHVESIGFGGDFRPGCWTPMVVYLVPTTSSPFAGRIEVFQEDIDRDTVHFTRQINFSGNPQGGGTTEARFWMYFIPQSSRGKGRALDGMQTKDELTEIIKVRLCSDDGRELVKLPITQTMRPLESSGQEHRGLKAVLCVHKEHLPNLSEYRNMLGLGEDINAIALREVAFGLPDDVIGYDGIDAIVWTDANPKDLSVEQVRAIEGFVKRGGRLVFSQDTTTNQWQWNNEKFPTLMPVTVRGVDEKGDVKKDLETLFELASRGMDPFEKRRLKPEWDKIKGPIRTATAIPRPQANVALYERAKMPGEHLKEDRPWLVRMPVGAGCVTWVAQDLGERNLMVHSSAAEIGWAKIWDAVFDWRNDPISPQTATDRQKAMYGGNYTLETGKGTLQYMDLPSTSAALIGIAVVFFIMYWAVAGWGSYWALATRKKAHLSWFMFGLIAIAATGLTYIIVKLVLRGDPQLQHVSYVRCVRGEPASVRAQFGLYIPRDGRERVELKETAGNPSYVTAFPVHPAFLGDPSDYLNHQDYIVPVREMVESDRPNLTPRVIQVPYRSTLKKFQANWVGNLPGIEGTPKLAEGDQSPNFPIITGRIRNSTGRDLRMVYLAFQHQPNPGEAPLDFVLYISRWRAGDELMLDKELLRPAFGGAAQVAEDSPLNAADVVRLQGNIRPDRGGGVNWLNKWYRDFRSSNAFGEQTKVESDPLTPQLFPILSFYDRLYPSKSRLGERPDRFEILRRGVRHLDLSSAVSAGNMAIIAVADQPDQPLPFPLEVSGQRVKGKGIVYYQYVIPLDRSALNRPPMKPETQPATRRTEDEGKVEK